MDFRQYGGDNDDDSIVRELLSDAIKTLGGYKSAVFKIKDKNEILQKIHNELSESHLNIERAQKNCVKVEKIQQMTVNEKSSVRDLNLAALMTHPDYLGNVYFHRGNALMSAKRWCQAIQDYNLAIKHRKNVDDVYKISYKIGQCCLKKKQYSQAVKSFKQALNQLDNAENVSEKARTEFTKIINDCIAKFSSKKNENPVNVKEFEVLKPCSIDTRVTDTVEVLETIGKGRNAFAKENIPVGSVLAIVDGFGAHLNPDDPNQVMQYCLNCMKGVEVPYPCNTCPRVVFCSDKCQEEAQGSYHKYQCQLDLYNIRLNDSKDGCTIFQSLMVIFGKPAKFWIEHQSKMLSSCDDSEWPAEALNDVQHLTLLFQMATNEESVAADTRARHALVVVLLLRAIRLTSYYADSGLKTPTAGLTNEELVIGKLIYKLRLIQDMNSHPIWGVSANTKDDQLAKNHIGGGMYPAIGSYFNSDCNPNTIRVNIGRKMLLIASKNIKKGEEVMDNYCIHFSELPTQTRRPWIQDHFLFHCECEACEHDWPVYKQLPQSRPSQKVADKLVTLEMENITAIEQGKIEKAVKALEQEITLIQGSLSEPHQLSVNIRNTYQFCWWKKVVDYLQKKKEIIS